MSQENQTTNELPVIDSTTRYLMDDALFGDVLTVRVRAVNQLCKLHGTSTIPILQQIVSTLTITDGHFKTFCSNTIKKLDSNDRKTMLCRQALDNL